MYSPVVGRITSLLSGLPFPPPRKATTCANLLGVLAESESDLLIFIPSRLDRKSIGHLYSPYKPSNKRKDQIWHVLGKATFCPRGGGVAIEYIT